MTIHPPKIVIDEKEPFKDALFDRKAFGKSLVNILRRVSDNLVIFVNAPWGAGKTTFARMWLSYLKDHEKLEVIYYDAYSADYFDDPFVSFSGEILELAKHLPGGKNLKERKEFKKSAVEVAKRLAGLTAKIGLRAATLGAIESTQVDELKDIGTEIATGVSEAGSDLIEKKIENYIEEKDALKDFKKKLAKLAAKFREERDFPLTVVVDELDRCRPDFALGLLERIKHLFDVEGVAFVLLVNRDQIENYIRIVYGDEVDAQSYLLKFGNLFVDLPNRGSQFSFQYQRGRMDYCQNLVAHYGLSTLEDSRFLGTCAGLLSDHFELTLREIERVFAAMSLFYASSDGNERKHHFLITALSVLKIKKPDFYKSLGRGNISVGQFFEISKLDKLEVSNDVAFNLDWAKNMLDYCLMSDDEFALVTSELNHPANVRPEFREMFSFIGRNRKAVIPSLCWRLDQFSLGTE